MEKIRKRLKRRRCVSTAFSALDVAQCVTHAVRCCRIRNTQRTKRLVTLFESIDVDRSGTVSSKELFFACARAGLQVGLDDIKAMAMRGATAENNYGDHLRLYDFIAMFDGVDEQMPELPRLVGWVRVERPLQRLQLAARKDQWQAAQNILETAAAEMDKDDDLLWLSIEVGPEECELVRQEYAYYVQEMRRFLGQRLGVDSQSSGSEAEMDEDGQLVLTPRAAATVRPRSAFPRWTACNAWHAQYTPHTPSAAVGRQGG
jgi:hypothetical protein